MSKIDKNIEHFRSVVKNSHSYSEIGRKMGYKQSGGIHKLLKIKVQEYDIDINHLKGQAWNKGLTKEENDSIKKMGITRPWKELFRKGSVVHNSVLLRMLIASGKVYKCSVCNIANWNDKPLRLQIDHINGDNTDNREDNLRIICPNCHSQTNTFSRGNRKPKETIKWWHKISMSPCGGMADPYP